MQRGGAAKGTKYFFWLGLQHIFLHSLSCRQHESNPRPIISYFTRSLLVLEINLFIAGEPFTFVAHVSIGHFHGSTSTCPGGNQGELLGRAEQLEQTEPPTSALGALISSLIYRCCSTKSKTRIRCLIIFVSISWITLLQCFNWSQQDNGENASSAGTRYNRPASKSPSQWQPSPSSSRDQQPHQQNYYPQDQPSALCH